MNNKLAKILSLCIILTLVFSFAACSDKKDDVKNEAKKSSAEKTEPPKTQEVKSDAVLTSDTSSVSQAPATPNATTEAPSPKQDAAQPTVKEEPQQSSQAPGQPAPAPDQNNQAQDTTGKYADAEIYEKEGKKYAKTDDGTEVEMSGDNLQKMMQDYSKVQGSGSAEEKEILDKIQVILDNADKLN